MLSIVPWEDIVLLGLLLKHPALQEHTNLNMEHIPSPIAGLALPVHFAVVANPIPIIVRMANMVFASADKIHHVANLAMLAGFVRVQV